MRKIVLTSLVGFLLLMPVVSNALAWELERPADYEPIDETVHTSYTDGKASVGLGVHISEYTEDSPTHGDYAILNVAATANTRQIITYNTYSDYYSWHDNLPNQLFLGDDDGTWVWMQGIRTRFYGGPNSAEYDSIWVSSNGFISFSSNSTYPYYSKSIPNTYEPNTFIAPFWRDLDPSLGGSITYGVVQHWPGYGQSIECFAISWNNIRDKENVMPQTFQVLVENMPGFSMRHRQSRIWIQYNSITLDDEQTTIGIEDQQGGKGVSYNYQDVYNEMTLKFEQSSNSAFVNYLTIKLIKDDPYADVDIVWDVEDPYWVRGYNVKLLDEEPDPTGTYVRAIGGTATLLIGAFSPWGWLSAAGLMMSTILVVGGWSEIYAKSMAKARDPIVEDWQSTNFVRVAAVEDPSQIYISDALDASVGIRVYWYFNDANDRDHSLNISSELIYYEYNAYGTVVNVGNISTTQLIDLQFKADANNSFDTAKTIENGYHSRVYLGGSDTEDYYTFHAESGQRIDVVMTPPGDADFDLYLYNDTRQIKASSEKRGNYSESIGFTADSTGYWFLKMTKWMGGGFYSFTLSVYDDPPGGGCPILYVYDGSEYAYEGLLDIHNPDGTDVVRKHTLTTIPQRVYGTYWMRLVEHPQTISHIDQVKLYAALENQTTIQLPLIWAWHSEEGFTLPQLWFSDEWKVDTLGANHNNGTSQSISLKFLALPLNLKATAFTFQIEGNNPNYKR